MARQDDEPPRIPMDVAAEVLSRLPAESLVRFRAVSKAWNTCISDPRFVKSHFQRSKNSTSHNLFLGMTGYSLANNYVGKFSLHRLEGQKFRTEEKFEAPEDSTEVLCFCDGHVLLHGRLKNIFRLWNPSTRRSTQLYLPSWFENEPKFGLCHDPTIDDFKIIFFTGARYTVYSCAKKSWTKTNDDDCVSGINRDTGICVCGAVYWVWNERSSIEDSTRDFKPNRNIIYFDARVDEFKMLQTPEDLKKTDLFSLICLRDRLCVAFYDMDKSMVQIWIKEEGRDQNSWMDFMTIENVPMPLPLGLFKPLYFRESKVVIRLQGARFLVYSPGEKTFEEFEDAGVLHTRLVPYVDSLLFFPTQKILPWRKRNPSIVEVE